MDNEKIERFSSFLHDAACGGTLRTLVLYSPRLKSGELQKIRASLKNIGGENVLQAESFLTEGRVTHRNIPLEEVGKYFIEVFGDFRKADLMASDGDASLMISKKGDRVSLISKKASNSAPVVVSGGNDRKKHHLLTGDEPFMRELGISDSNGRIKDKMMPKFRQINRFCEYVKEAVSKIGVKDRIDVADLCCGKSYLSFAAYHTLTEILSLECEMYCVDLKASVIADCAKTAETCAYSGMHFICMNISDYVPERSPDMVISLHACDTATDAVLDFAVKHRVSAVLATPCCHHEMSEKINCPELDFIANVPILRQKLCAAATDSLRLLRLQAHGYEADATELIDPESTPKNVMLRGYLHPRGDMMSRARDAYIMAYRFIYGTSPDGEFN